MIFWKQKMERTSGAAGGARGVFPDSRVCLMAHAFAAFKCASAQIDERGVLSMKNNRERALRSHMMHCLASARKQAHLARPDFRKNARISVLTRTLNAAMKNGQPLFFWGCPLPVYDRQISWLRAFSGAGR